MQDLEYAQAEVARLQNLIDGSKPLIEELSQREKAALRAGGFDSPEYQALGAAISGIGQRNQRLRLEIDAIIRAMRPQ